ncbi:MAG TPA: hypothetical protein VM431_03200 [Phycisphaerae bacterium]|nr:hypothetical protein [Phycisphaerae bacterium]
MTDPACRLLILSMALLAAAGVPRSWAAEVAPPAAPESQALIDTDFAAAEYRPVTPPEAARERLSGALPAGWTDDSGWAKVWVRYGRVEEGGRAFLRAEVTRLDDGRAQFHHNLPDYGDDTYVRLEMTLRSAAGQAVEVGIRMQGPPYDFLWRRVVSPPREWKTYTFDFRQNKPPQPVGLWINQGSVGTLDLARVRVVRMTREGLVAELRRTYPEGGPPNLLRHSRLPLGLQSGWTLGRDNSDGDDVVADADPQVDGPSGAAALAVRGGETVVLYGAPFAVPLCFDEHTASVFVRGTGELRLAVVSDAGWPANKGFKVSGDAWQRVEVPFKPALLARFHALRMEVKGTLWLDAFQVNRGTAATPYVPQLACEVALAVESPARVQFDGEPAVVRYAVTGNVPGGVLKARVVNLYGDEARLSDVPLPEGFLRQGELAYDVFPEKPYGPMRIEAWVETADGRPASPVGELVVFRLRRPRYWMKDAPDSPFGTHTNSTTRHILMAKAVGINWTRLHDAGTPYIGWYHLEPEKGKWQFCDKELKRYRRWGMKVLGSFSTAPRWASYFADQKPHDGYFDRFYQPKRMEDFAEYVRTVAQRYKGVIDAYDVWNEPWIHAWWGVDYDESKRDRQGYLTSKEPQKDFVRLMKTAYEVAKQVDPGITVLGVNTTTDGGGEHSISGTEWTRGIVEHGGLDFCDAIAYHQYTGAGLGFPGDAAQMGYQDAIGPIIEKVGRAPKPVWMTEGSAHYGLIGDGFYRHTLPWEGEEDFLASADRMARHLVGLLAQGVGKIFLYSMHCHTYFGDEGWRAIVTPEGYLHPCAAGHSAAAYWLEDTRFVKTVACAGGVTAYLFEGGGRAVAVVSPAAGHAAYAPPRAQGIQVLDVLGNPVGRDETLGARVMYLTGVRTAADLERLLAPK